MTSHKQCLIPGPIEVSDQVLESMATKATSHVDPSFIQTFSSALKLLRKVFVTENAQPVILAGSGTLTWDVCASNLVDKNDNVLVIITGIFGTWYQECLEVYGANVDVIEASFGASVSCADILTKLASKEYKMIALTHVDTSTSVLLNLKQICIEIKNSFPNLLIVVDGVCSIGAEELRFDDWGIDFAGTASQKAIGCPPGLAIMMISQRAVKIALEKQVATSYYANLKKWIPIMVKYENLNACYFATPPVQLIMALNTSLSQFSLKMPDRFQKHYETSALFKQRLQSIGLKFVPELNDCANTLTAIRYPENINPGDLLKKIGSKGFVVAGGLYPGKQGEYFRVGHMGESCYRDDIDLVFEAIKESLKELNYKF